jgi:hypothetical protein
MKSFTPALAVIASLLFSTAVRADDVDPFGFEKEHFISSKSRAEVVADLKAAQAAGQLPAFGEIGVRFADAPSIKSRAQVVAETREAARLGLLGGYGELGPKQATPEQEKQIEVAGMRAVGGKLVKGD